MPSSRAISTEARPTRSLWPRVYRSLMSTACTSARMVAWWAARSRWYCAKTQQEMYIGSSTKQRGDAARTGCATAPPSSARRARAPVRPGAAGEQPAPGGAQRQPLGRDEDAAVQRGQDERRRASAAAPAGTRPYGKSDRGAVPRSRRTQPRTPGPGRARRRGRAGRPRQTRRAEAGRGSTRASSAPGSATSAAAAGGSRKTAASSTGKKRAEAPAPPGIRRPTAGSAGRIRSTA